jgi:hypothetical protein
MEGATDGPYRGQAPVVSRRGGAGDPHEMSVELRQSLEPVFSSDGLLVRHQRQWPPILFGWGETSRYEVRDLTNRLVLDAGDTGDGWGSAFTRTLWPFREQCVEVLTLGGIRALLVRWRRGRFLPRIHVEAWNGRPLGVIAARWVVFRHAFEVLDPGGGEVATIQSGVWGPRTYAVASAGTEVAVIRKRRLLGGPQERLMTADEYGIEFHPALKDPVLRQLLLAATLAIDLVAFKDPWRARPARRWGLRDFIED